ncbi:MAG TPA: glycosyl hydrolase family 28 protein [Polyangia bacterium]|nr:glycosyl hydrolase family 28 protein [Polyangia bacterium]
MAKQHNGLTSRRRAARLSLACASRAVLLLGLAACGANDDLPAIETVCGTAARADLVGGPACGAGDPNLPAEPQLPADACQILMAVRSAPTERDDGTDLDTTRIQAALLACKGKAVKLVSDGQNNAFVTAHLQVDSVTLWIDQGTTLYASRNPALYQKTGNCGSIGISDSGACTDFITLAGKSPGIVGDGIIDGQGGEPLIGKNHSWWQASYALRAIDGSIGNPTLINSTTGTTGLLLYRITLHNSPKFHVKITSYPADGNCSTPGKGFIVWGITILTPSRWTNSRGDVLTPSFARNTDGVDPGEGNVAQCGVIACSTISTGDDQIAIKGGHLVSELVIAHNHFGTGHGMSIGSETFGHDTTHDGVTARGVENVSIYDLTIDADSRPVGSSATAADFNGIRVKSDESRGGLVNNISYSQICMRDMTNAILVSTAYNPQFAGTSFPDFRALTFQNIRHVTCMGLQRPVVTLEGFNATLPLGPVTLNNVIIDNMGSLDVAAEFANITLGPGDVNFTPAGQGVVVTDIRSESTPMPCVFPPLPAPETPAGWLR